ncbi:hypothetical protein E3P86_01866 [Wallemia ichthyophaga]|uniref:Major facilitator superfamily (MFS) profile domain-containing protein n=1 Tax=Wallemia ichthyophaga TaxID=245174 RepID=A0A4T0J5S3_WALIC|nr:hypothetical protein E3P86_01866 [Wallemia ichthyophaga]
MVATGIDPGDDSFSRSLSRCSTVHDSTPPEQKSVSNWVEIDDNDDPQRWPQSEKLKVMIATIGFCILVSGASSSFAVGVSSMVDDLHTSTELGSTALAIFVIGFAIAPMFFAGASEELGRTPMYAITFTIYGAMFLPIGLCSSITGIIISRFIQGLAGSSGSTMVAGTISDLYGSHERGIYMSFFALSTMSSTGITPMVYSFVPLKTSLSVAGSSGKGGWRWIQIIQCIVTACYGIVMVLFLKETRINVIMKKKARRMRKETGDTTIKAHAEVFKPTKKELLQQSLFRPMQYLTQEPIVIAFSFFIGYAWAIFYSFIASITHVFLTLYEDNYGMNQGTVGYVYASIVVGSVFGFLFNYFFQEKFFFQRFNKSRPVEARLGGAMASGIIFPIGAFIYAFTLYPHVHPAGPCVGLTVILTGMFSIYLSSMSYLADCYQANASSALAAIALIRNLTGGVVILVIRQWYDGMGFVWAGLLISLLAVVFATVPIALFFFGKQLRMRSKFAQEIAKMLEDERLAVKQEQFSENPVEIDRRTSMQQVELSRSSSSTIDVNLDTRETYNDNSNYKSDTDKDSQHVQHIFIEIDDKDDPMRWPKYKKMRIAIAAIGFSVFVSASTATFAQGLYQLVTDLDTTTELANVAQGIFVVAFAFPPMLLAGLSEEYGRSKIFLVSYALYTLLHLPIALSTNITGVILGRLFQGLAASTGSTLTAGTIADIYTGYHRALWMSIFAASSPLATGVAPVVYSYVPSNYALHFKGSSGVGGWRWIQIIQMIVAFVWGIVLCLWFRETRVNVIMKKKARRMRKETGDHSLQAEAEQYRMSKHQMFRNSFLRPLKFLLTEPIVAVMSMFIGFAWAVFFSLQASISHVFLTLYSDNYAMTHGSVGFVFIAIIVGTVIGFVFNLYFQEKWFYDKFYPRYSVEARLGSSMISGIVFPIGAFIYAFTTYNFVHWIAPCIAITVIMAGIFPIYYSSMNYLSECYGTTASSALASIAMVRNLTGGCIQFVILQWLDGLGDRFQYALLMIAVMATALAVIPIALFLFGSRIRQRSTYAQAISANESATVAEKD